MRDPLPGGRGLDLTLAAGAHGLDHEIQLSRVQRPGLALTGYTDYIRYGRVQIVGSSEIGYLRKLSAQPAGRHPRKALPLPHLLLRGHEGPRAPAELLAAAEARGIPVLTTPAESTPFIKLLSAFLDERLAIRLHLHSVLMDVFGLGVLIMGESGIGKSECALDLIDRGHRLVADDVVEIKRMADALIGSSPDLTRYHMELRGLGVINIKDLYGVSSIRVSKRVELVINLERWEAGKEYDRLGLHDEKFLILGVEVPLLRMPVAPGRNIAILVEVAARNQLLKERGYDAARRFAERVDEIMAARAPASRCGHVRHRRRVGVPGRAPPEPVVGPRVRPRRVPTLMASTPRPSRRVLVITGLSGSGKTHVSRALEDSGWFCVDNLPSALIPPFAELIRSSPALQRSALVVDIREPDFLRRFPEVFRRLKRRGLEASPPLPRGRRARPACGASARRGGPTPWP